MSSLVEFDIYDSVTSPFTEPSTGTLIDRPAVHVFIEVPVDVLFPMPGITGPFVIRLHTDAGMNVQLQTP